MTDRGQTLLVGAIGLAVLFVTMALVLNSAIYGSALASQGSASVSGGDTMLLQQSVERDVEFLVASAVEHQPGTYDTTASRGAQEDYVFNNVSRLNERYRRYYADSDRIVTLSHSGFTDGYHLYRNSNGAFPSGSPSVVATNTLVRDFTVKVDSFSGSAFEIQFEEPAGSTWIVRVEDTTGTKVELQDPSGTAVESCTTLNDSPWINVTEGTLDGEHCSALDFFERVEESYDVQFSNGGAVSGTYSFVVKEGSSTTVNEVQVESSQRVMYAANATVTVTSGSERYDHTVRAAPGEPS